MAVQTKVGTRVAYKKESTFGTLPGATGAQTLRRLDSTLGLEIAQIESNEVRTDQQRGEARSGKKTVQGNLTGELSPKTYADFIASALRRNFAAVATISAASVTATVAAPNFVRAAGSFLTDGIKIGMLVKPSAGANASKLFTVTAVTATGLTVAETVTAHGATTMDLSVPGKVTYVPQTGHTNDSYTIEHWHDDVDVSHRFTGCRVNSVKIDAPPNEAAKIDIGFMGQDRQSAGTAYFTSPTAATTTGTATGAKGSLVLDGAVQAIVTGYSLEIDGGMEVGGVVGSQLTPDVFVGSVTVKGSLSVYFTGSALDDKFTGETPVTLVLRLDDGIADSLTLTVPRAKLAGGSLSGDKEVIQQFTFNAAPVAVTGAELTSVQVQDTAA